MKRFMVRGELRLAFVLVGLLWSASSYSVVVQIDEFVIDKNSSIVFADTFFNNLTPSQESSTYAVLGAFPNGAESGGQLTLNSDWGGSSENAAGQARQTLRTTYLSNIVNPAAPTALTSSDIIDVTGTFSLVTPFGPLTNGYGLQVVDTLLGQPVDRLVELDVQYNINFGGNVIRFLLQDFTNGTITTLGFVPFVPPAGADQIELMIFRPNANSDDFLGGFAFGTGGTFGSVTTFATPGELFTNTDFVRARFIAFTAVPEPGTLALFGLGLAGLAASRRRKQ